MPTYKSVLFTMMILLARVICINWVTTLKESFNTSKILSSMPGKCSGIGLIDGYY